MYTLEITPEEWELVYAAAFTPDGYTENVPAWAQALIDAPIWSTGLSELSVDHVRTLVEAFRADITDEGDGFPKLPTDTMLFYKLHVLWADFTLDMREEENG